MKTSAEIIFKQQVIIIKGKLNHYTIAPLWPKLIHFIENNQNKTLSLQLEQITEFNHAGLGLILVCFQRHKNIKLQGASDLLTENLQLYLHKNLQNPIIKKTTTNFNFGFNFIEFKQFIKFHLTVLKNLFTQTPHFKPIHWQYLVYFFENIGVNAIFITLLLGLLLGIILSLQAAITLQYLGFELYIIHLVAISVSQELGPLLIAILISSRSGAAFASDLASMRKNQEIHALITMSISPIKLLVLPRIIAMVIITPWLMLYLWLIALIASALFLKSIGYSFSLYLSYLTQALTFSDITTGIIKTLVFSFFIGTISCFYGLQENKGIGEAATSSVVMSLIMVIICDVIIGAILYLFSR